METTPKYFLIHAQTNTVVASFAEYNMANNCRNSLNNKSEYVVKRISTERQMNAVKFIVNQIDVKFKGDINLFDDCKIFISMYLDDAIKDREFWRKNTGVDTAEDFMSYIF